MAVGGKNAAFTFAGTVYDADDCLQGWDLNSSINDIVYQCNGYDKHAVGTKVISFRTSLALPADTTIWIDLAPGTTGAFEGYPAGATTDYMAITATRGMVVSAPMTAPINGIIAIDVEIVLDDVTYTCA